MRHREMDAVAGEPVVDGQHEAAGPRGQFPCQLVRLPHVQVAVGEAAAMHPDQGGKAITGRDAITGGTGRAPPADAGPP